MSLVSSIKLAALGLVAFALAACARSQGLNALAWDEPRVGEPPKSGDMTYSKMSRDEAEAAHVERLEKELAELTIEISGVRAALAAMGPLPPQDMFFIPVEYAAATAPMDAPFKLMDLYAEAPVLRNAKSLFATPSAAAASQPRSENRITQLASNIRFDVAPSGLLSADGLSRDPEINALCVELSALGAECSALPIVRGGQR